MRMRTLTASVALGLAAALALAATANATTFRVTRADDPIPDACIPGDCSLREAVIAANAAFGSDKVMLPLSARYELAIPNLVPGEGDDDSAQGDLDVDGGALTILHKGSGRATIDANGLDRVIEVTAGDVTRLDRVVLTGGANPVSQGTTHDGDGGAIRSEADVTITDSKLRSNSAQDGGAIHLEGAARLVLDRTTIASNTADGEGGGAFLSGPERDQVARIRRSTIDGNSAGVDGGGIAAPSGIVRATASTLSANVAGRDGGGIRIGADARLFALNSTIAKNRAGAGGGGIRSAGQGSINATTVARNVADADRDGAGAGAGVLSDLAGFELENSLIALNRLGSGALGDCAGGRFDSDGDNLVSGFVPGSCSGIDFVGDIVDPDPGIKGLARNHGETRTIALRRASPAVGAAGPQSSPRRDQRHFVRDSEPDIGAYELGARRANGDRSR
jgi:Right handed beta helix region